MSEIIMRRVWDHAPVARSPQGRYELLVLLALAHEADDHGHAPYHDAAYLAAKTRQPMHTVVQCIEALRARGLLHYHITPTREAVYILHIPDPEEAA